MRQNDPRLFDFGPTTGPPNLPRYRAEQQEGGLSSQGYGGRNIQVPPERSYPLATPADQAMALAISEAIRATLLVTELAPTHHPPFRAIPLDVFGEGIVIANGGDADAGTAASRLNEATGISILSESSATDQVLVSYTVPERSVAVIRRYGVEAEGRRQARDLDFSLELGGRRFRYPNNESSAIAGVDEAGMASTFAIAQAGEVVRLRVSNTSTLVPHVVAGRLWGWEFPVGPYPSTMRGLLIDR